MIFKKGQLWNNEYGSRFSVLDSNEHIYKIQFSSYKKRKKEYVAVDQIYDYGYEKLKMLVIKSHYRLDVIRTFQRLMDKENETKDILLS